MKSGTMKKGVMLAALTLSSAMLSGCLSFGGKAPKQLITLTPESTAPAGSLGGGKLADAVVVLDPQTDRKIDVLRVPVKVDEVTVAYLKDATWIERPARQFRHLLAETIRAKGQRLVLEDTDNQAGGKLRIGGRLVDLGYDGSSGSVVVRYDAVREDAAGNIVSQRFEAEVAGVEPKAEAIAPALNRAANDVARQVADWIG